MKVDITMPKLGESLTEGTVLKWWKKEGDPVKKDEVLLEVSTDKVDSEIPSPSDGILAEIVAKEQETIEVGNVLARLETEKIPEEQETQAPQDEASEKTGSAPETKETEKKEKAIAREEKTAGQTVDIVMPKMGESLTEGTILKWWKSPGEEISRDETLVEISTDKVDSEIPSPVDGKLQEILFEENETVEIGQVIARVSTSKAAAEQLKSQGSPQISEKQEEEKTTPAPEEAAEVPSGQAERIGPETGRFYSPLVRTIALREGIPMNELEKIPGSGHRKRVTKKDILDYLRKREKTPARKAPAATAEPARVGGEDTVIPMDNVRKKIAEHMRNSLDTSAHVYSVSECDMTNVMKLMYDVRDNFRKEEGFKLTVTPFILYATVKALQDFPGVNSALNGDNIIVKKNINLGIAVASERGLIVPVVKKAEEKSFRGLARSVNDLVIRTRENKLNYNDIEGSTFSVTNYGIFGNIIGLPIINQPNVAILGIGAIRKRPVVIEKEEGDFIAVRSMTYISMSYDHRLIDGELGGRFMQRLVEYLEEMGGEVL